MRYALDLDEDLLSEIYPDLDEQEIASKLELIESGDIPIEEVLDDAQNNDIEIEWLVQDEDMWSWRKGNFEVTYEIGDEDSWAKVEEDEPHTHKCSKCKWTGDQFDGVSVRIDVAEGEPAHVKRVCQYCDSDIVPIEH
jgi:ribosomal protein L37AE/L43A